MSSFRNFVKRSHQICSAILLASFPFHCNAQSLPYADADTSSEAVGMFKMTIGLADHMKQECTKRFPELQVMIEKDIQKWRSLDAKEIAITERRFREMERMSPKLSQQYSEMVKQAYENKLVAPFRGMDASVERKVVRGYCQQFFNELATGVWRQRTPKVYQYLSQP